VVGGQSVIQLTTCHYFSNSFLSLFSSRFISPSSVS
jgi:hypothetical protein